MRIVRKGSHEKLHTESSVCDETRNRQVASSRAGIQSVRRIRISLIL